MAIQPVDLQLAYLAAPASAAVASNAQQAPAVAQQAAQAAFAAQVEQREETIEETSKTEGSKIREREAGGDAGTYSPRKRRQDTYQAAGSDEEVQAAVSGEQHFIDTTA
jgi:hypothetical protein